MKRALFLFFAFVPGRLDAQKQSIEPDACIYRIPSASLKRVPVFLQATSDSRNKVVLPAADLFAQSVGFKIREILGATESQLAEADSVVDWRRLWGEVIVTLHRGDKPTWKVPEWSSRADTISNSSIRLLTRAIRETLAAGEIVPFPDSLVGDSIEFSLSLINPTVTKEGKVLPVAVRQPIPVFSISIAWERNVEMIRRPNIDFPPGPSKARVVGGVQMIYSVDKSGRVIPDTMRDIWPAGVVKPSGEMLRFYDDFLRAIKRDLPGAKFAPAMVGGCPLKQVVQQFFEFQ